MIGAGLPYQPDMFSTGASSHGCGDVPRTVHKGIRSTAADFITKNNRRANIRILTSVTVDKILFDQKDGEEPTATHVSTISPSGRRIDYHARREIIITTGAYCTPPLLMRSGIGPKSQLEQHNIPVLIDAPGVGANLQDHVLCFIFYEVGPGVTNDHLAYHDNAIAASYAQYQAEKSGVLSTFPFGVFGYARLDERLQDSELWRNAPREQGRDPMGLLPSQPNIEFWNTELYGGPKQYADFPVEGNKSAFAMCVLLFNQHSRGSVTLASKDPSVNPAVDHAYMADPLDMLVMSEACRFGNEIIMSGGATKGVVKGSWPAGLAHHGFTKREEWEPHVREHATTCYHASGTCKMGKDGDAMAVLDGRLRVKGVKGLRVADVSVVPRVNNGHTQMVAYGIGEGAAEMIREDAKREGGMYS
jgi:choline dehydrogenase-like flavoprotein